jgi:hypothetical protein
MAYQYNSNFDRVDFINEKPPVDAGGLRKTTDWRQSDKTYKNDLMLSDSSNLYKQKELSMSNLAFVKLNRNETTEWLLKKYPNAFLLLTQICLRARRYDGHIDGKIIGEAEIGDYWNAGIESEKKYRIAKMVLVEKKIIEISYTNKMKKNNQGRPVFDEKSENDKKRATERATKRATEISYNGTIVKLLCSDIYDINIDFENNEKGDRKGDQKGDRGATEGRPKGDEQEYKEDKNDKENHPSEFPSFSAPTGLIDLNDSFSKKIKVMENIEMSEKDYEECLKISGNKEKLEKHVKFIWDSPSRKSNIKNWPNALKKWKMPDEFINKKMDNEEFGKKLEIDYFGNKAWCLRVYHDTIKDQNGILFENQGAAGGLIFISFSEPDFKNKIEKMIKEKRMINFNQKK